VAEVLICIPYVNAPARPTFLLSIHDWCLGPLLLQFGRLLQFEVDVLVRETDFLLLKVLESVGRISMLGFVKHEKTLINSTDWLDIIRQISKLADLGGGGRGQLKTVTNLAKTQIGYVRPISIRSTWEERGELIWREVA
jgi:hypothetical protein